MSHLPMKIGPRQRPRTSSLQPNLQGHSDQRENLQEHRQPIPGRALQAIAADLHAAMNVVNLLFLRRLGRLPLFLEARVDMSDDGVLDSKADPILRKQN